MKVRWGQKSPPKYFAELKDPQVERTREHLLEKILLIAIAAILNGASGWNEIENYGKAKAVEMTVHGKGEKRWNCFSALSATLEIAGAHSNIPTATTNTTGMNIFPQSPAG